MVKWWLKNYWKTCKDIAKHCQIYRSSFYLKQLNSYMIFTLVCSPLTYFKISAFIIGKLKQTKFIFLRDVFISLTICLNN